MTTAGPLLRVFEVRAKDGCVETLLENFATTSAEVVDGKSGNKGYFFGRCVQVIDIALRVRRDDALADRFDITVHPLRF